jgi:hypothetical protein
MRKLSRTLVIVIGTLLAMLAVVGTANAVRDIERVELIAGDLKIVGSGGFQPEALPRFHNAPITFHGGGKISTLSGELPPIIETLQFEFDKHGAVDTTGLPFCTEKQLIATSVAAARRACGDATIGKGFGSVVVKFPEQAPIPVGSPLTFFNGPKVHGNDTVLAHTHLNDPVSATFVVPIVIEKIHKGVYGYRVNITIPKIANGYGIPISGSAKIGRFWTYKGKKHSYVNARCETGHLQARGEFTFKDGPPQTTLVGNFIRPCKVRK